MNHSLPGFLAHAIALEHGAAERCLELADMMEAHRNDEVRRRPAEFAAGETEHLQALDDWLARAPRPSIPWRDDLERPAPA